MDKRLELISAIGVVPVIEIDDTGKAVPLAEALTAGGLPIAEVSFRTEAAEASIRLISRECPEVLVGAGAVLNCGQVDATIAAGGTFIVTPGFDPEVVRYALSKGLAVIPGVSTPEEVKQAMDMGVQTVGLSSAGDVSKLEALGPSCKGLIWGGIDADEMSGSLSQGQLLACGGSWRAQRELTQKEDWKAITALCRETVRAMLGFRVVHVGMNCADAVEAERIAHLFCSLFDVPYLPNETAVFAGSLVECIKGPYLGMHGHIAIGANDVDRAVYHLERRGAAFDEASRKVDSDGHTTLIYFQGEIGGFALHLVKNRPSA